jgi:hypothetical protein
MNEGFATVLLLCPLSAQDNADNTDNWKDTKLPSFPELDDFDTKAWNGVARPEGFEPPTFGFEVHRSIR